MKNLEEKSTKKLSGTRKVKDSTNGKILVEVNYASIEWRNLMMIMTQFEKIPLKEDELNSWQTK